MSSREAQFRCEVGKEALLNVRGVPICRNLTRIDRSMMQCRDQIAPGDALAVSLAEVIDLEDR